MSDDFYVEALAGDLKKALKVAARFCEKRNHIPVLDCALFQGGSIIATDLDSEVLVTFVKRAARGTAAIALYPLLGLVSRLPSQMVVTLRPSPDGDESVIADFDGGFYQLFTCPADDFPRFAADEKSLASFAPSNDFTRALRIVKTFISTEETRYYLNGCCLDGTRAVATDGWRLCVVDSSAPKGALDALTRKPIIPRTFLERVTGLNTPSKVTLNDKKVTFSYPGVVARGKLIDGTFPDYERLIPTNEPTATVSIEHREARNALSRLLAVQSERGAAVNFRVEGDVATFSGRLAGLGRAERLYGVSSVKGDKRQAVQFGFNPKLMRDVLASFEDTGATVLMDITKEENPVMFRSSNSSQYALLMPMRSASFDFAASVTARFEDQDKQAA